MLGVCLPEDVTDDVLNIRSIMYWQVSYKEEDLIEVDSIAAVSNSDYMNTFYRSGRFVCPRTLIFKLHKNITYIQTGIKS